MAYSAEAEAILKKCKPCSKKACTPCWMLPVKPKKKTKKRGSKV